VTRVSRKSRRSTVPRRVFADRSGRCQTSPRWINDGTAPPMVECPRQWCEVGVRRTIAMRYVFPHAPSRTVRDSFPSYGSPSGIDQVGCPALTNLPGEARLYPRGCHHTSLLAFRRCRTSLCPELWSFSAYGGYYDHSAPPPPPQPQVAQSSRTEGDGSHVRALLLCDRVRPPLMPVRLTHNRRRSPVAYSPQTRGVHPYVWAFGATLQYSRYTSSPTIPIICGRFRFRTCHRGFLHVAIPVSGRGTP